MPNLSPTQIKKTSKLARLHEELTDVQIIKIGTKLDAIVSYGDQLQSVDTTGINPLDGWRTNTLSDLRNDEVSADTVIYARVRQNIIGGFPQKKGDLLKISGIFEGD
jgi:aspartyl/glutamyl-tRNA(Asn/Gln) amidotransferase C subunit